MLLAVLAALIGFVAFMVISRRSNMDWYVSPPIDAQGRRVHILVPNGWSLSNSSNDGVGSDGSGSWRTLTLSPVRTSLAASFVARWLVKLRLTSPVPEGSVDLNLYRIAAQDANTPFQPGHNPHTDLVRLKITMARTNTCRALSDNSTDATVGIICALDSEADSTNLAERICRSAYIK